MSFTKVRKIHWVEFEHIVRNGRFIREFGENDKSSDQYKRAMKLWDDFKTAVIALMGCKLYNDTNDVFYVNMREQALGSLEALKEEEVPELIERTNVDKLLAFIEWHF